MKTPLPQITDSEWVVMKVLWEKSPLLNRDIIKSVGGGAHGTTKPLRLC